MEVGGEPRRGKKQLLEMVQRDHEHIEIAGAPAHLRLVEWEAAGLRLRQLGKFTNRLLPLAIQQGGEHR